MGGREVELVDRVSRPGQVPAALLNRSVKHLIGKPLLHFVTALCSIYRRWSSSTIVAVAVLSCGRTRPEWKGVASDPPALASAAHASDHRGTIIGLC